MGQRHQLFVVARIGNRYRNLAVLHHQWLYGHSALVACRRLCRIFQAPSNREALMTELRLAEKAPKSVWTEKADPLSPLAFPVIMTCHILGASFSLEEQNNSLVHPLPLSLDFQGGDNNDGITIIDISAPDAVRYCFVNWRGYADEDADDSDEDGADEDGDDSDEDGDNSNEDEDDFDEDGDDSDGDESSNTKSTRKEWDVPLAAKRYLRGYYKPKEWSEDMIETMADLKDFQVMDEAVLELANDSTNGIDNSKQTMAHFSAENTAQGASHLRDAALQTFLDQLFEQDLTQLPSLLEHVRELPGFNVALAEKLRAIPALVTSRPVGFALLIEAMSNSTTVDLSAFSDLEETQVEAIVKASQSTLTSLNISGISSVSQQLLRDLPTLAPSLKILYVMSNPGFTTPKEVASVIQNMQLAMVYHTGAFLEPLAAREFTVIDYGRNFPYLDISARQFKRIELEHSAQENSLVQIIYLGATPENYETEIDELRKIAGGNVPDLHCPWVAPLIGMTPALPRLFDTLRQFLYFMRSSAHAYQNGPHMGTLGNVLAKSSAISLLPTTADKAWQVRPIPVKLFVASDEMARSNWAPSFPPRNIKPGEWSLVIVKEGSPYVYVPNGNKDKIKYCFLTSTSNEASIPDPDSPPEVLSDTFNLDVKLADIDEFLSTQALSETEKNSLAHFWKHELLSEERYEPWQMTTEDVACTLLNLIADEWRKTWGLHESRMTQLRRS